MLLADERADHTLQPTALVNELYLKMAGERLSGWESREGFFHFAARAMRWILVDHARRRSRKKRLATEPEEWVLFGARAEYSPAEIMDLDLALDRLASVHDRQAHVVELRYFMGLSFPEIARALGLSLATVQRDWVAARAWLLRELGWKPVGVASAPQRAEGQ
jgi:RNA polymerase sigma factor (TIGR02999 family)